jgi:hypothetical protein
MDLTRDLGGILQCVERLHLGAELFLDAEIGPSLPLRELAQFLHFCGEGGLDALEPLNDVVVIALRWKRRQLGKSGPDIAQRALTGLEGEVRFCGKRLRPCSQLDELRERLLTLPQLARFGFGPLSLLLSLESRLFLAVPALLFGFQREPCRSSSA